MWKVYYNEIPKYKDLNYPQFLRSIFLKNFYLNNNNLQNILLLKSDSILFANIFTLNLKKGIQYNSSNYFIKVFIRFLKIKICFLGNWYLNNLPFFYFDKDIDISEVTKNIKKNILQ